MIRNRIYRHILFWVVLYFFDVFLFGFDSERYGLFMKIVVMLSWSVTYHIDVDLLKSQGFSVYVRPHTALETSDASSSPAVSFCGATPTRGD